MPPALARSRLLQRERREGESGEPMNPLYGHEGSRPRAPGRGGRWLAAAALVILVFLSHLGGISVPFQGDEYLAIHHLGTPGSWGRVLRGFVTTQYDLQLIQFYRPLAMASWAADLSLWGTNPVGFHTTSLLFYATNVVAVAVVGWVVLRSRAGALAAAALFAIHPMHPEVSVLSISRYTTLAVFGSLLSWLSFAGWRRRGWRPGRGLAAWCCAGGLLASESGLLAALWVGVEALLGPREGDRAPSRARAIGGMVPTALVVGTYLLLRRVAFGAMMGGYTALDPGAGMNPRELLLGLPALAEAFVRLLAPVPLDLEGAASWFHGSQARLTAAISVGAALVTLLLRARPRGPDRRRLGFLLAFTFAGALPYFSVWRESTGEAGQRTWYAPSIGVCLLLGWAVAAAARRGRRVSAGGFVLGLGLLFAVLLHQAIGTYREAGDTIRGIKTAVDAYLDRHPGADPVLLEGAPRVHDGAFVLLWGVPELFLEPLSSPPRRVFPLREAYPRGSSPLAQGLDWGLPHVVRWEDPPGRLVEVRGGKGEEPWIGRGEVLLERPVRELDPASDPRGGVPYAALPIPEALRGDAQILEVRGRCAGEGIVLEVRGLPTGQGRTIAVVGDGRDRRIVVALPPSEVVGLRWRTEKGAAVPVEDARVALRRGLPRLVIDFPSAEDVLVPADFPRPIGIASARSPAYRVTVLTRMGAHGGVLRGESPTIQDLFATPIGPDLYLAFPILHAIDFGEDTAFVRLEGLSEPDNPFSLVSVSSLVPLRVTRDLFERGEELATIYPR